MDQRSSPRTSPQILALIDAATVARPGDNPMQKVRVWMLTRLRELVSQKGLELTEDEKIEHCLMPVMFQEFNYDDISWSAREGRLGSLEDMVEIDVVVWSGGFKRSELSDADYKKYCDHCMKAIDRRVQPKRRLFPVRSLADVEEEERQQREEQERQKRQQSNLPPPAAEGEKAF